MVLRDRDAATGGDLGKTGSGLDERLYVQHDANFNVTALLNTSGTVVERYQLLPYRVVTVLDATFAALGGSGATAYVWKHLHQGGALDTATGLYHFRRREYSPSMARWVQQDPIGYADGVNLYQALLSNPSTSLDPGGTQQNFNARPQGYKYEGGRPVPGIGGPIKFDDGKPQSGTVRMQEGGQLIGPDGMPYGTRGSIYVEFEQDQPDCN